MPMRSRRGTAGGPPRPCRGGARRSAAALPRTVGRARRSPRRRARTGPRRRRGARRLRIAPRAASCRCPPRRSRSPSRRHPAASTPRAARAQRSCRRTARRPRGRAPRAMAGAPAAVPLGRTPVYAPARVGLDTSRLTVRAKLWDWVAGSAHLLEPATTRRRDRRSGSRTRPRRVHDLRNAAEHEDSRFTPARCVPVR